MATYFRTIINIKAIFAIGEGHIKRFFGVRRSRSDWPCYDDAYLWYGEEAYEYNHSGSTSEYMDVLGTIMILQVFHTFDFHNRIRRTSQISRSDFKKQFIKWWLRQYRRGRPNLNLRTTYYHFKRIHNTFKKQGK